MLSIDRIFAILYDVPNPKVSILLATYNRSYLISRAIESVLVQSFKNWELIVADDGSSDETPRAVREWQKKEPRIIYTRSEVNEGISKNYNRGFRMARGEYIAMIDDDDPWRDQDKLKKQVDFLENNGEYIGCGGGVIVFDSEGNELFRYLKPEKDEEIRKYMLFSNPMANSTTLFRKTAGEKVGWYDETTRYAGDRDFWLKMGLAGKLYNFPEYFSCYTMSDISTSILKIRPHLKASLMIMKRYKGKYPNYYSALLFNKLQYAYAYLPLGIRKVIHAALARLKRLILK